MKSFACNVKVNAIEYFHIKLNANEEIKVMKQKLRNLSAPANIIFAILAVFIFIAPLQWSGKVLGLIPGMEKADDYLLQAIVETVVLVIFLGITYIFGLWDIFKENAAGWTRSLYTGGFFIVYCLYAVVSGIYLCFLGEHGDVKAFYNIIFFFYFCFFK